MARKKVSLAFIANDATRRSTLRKRSRGLIKKVSELSTLCDVEACAVIYSPDNAIPEVYPSVPEARRILLNFKSLPEMQRTKKMTNQEMFLQERARKLSEQVRRMENAGRELDMSLLMCEDIVGGRNAGDVGMVDAMGFSYFLDGKLKAVQMMAESAEAGQAEEEEEKRNPAVGKPVVLEGKGKEVEEMNAAAEVMEQLSSTQNWLMDIGSPWNIDPSLFNF